MLSSSHGIAGVDKPISSTTSRAKPEMASSLDGMRWSDLRAWDGNIVCAVMQQIIYECPQPWFGCHWEDWEEIAMITPSMYYHARHLLVGERKMRVERIHVPGDRRQLLCHTLSTSHALLLDAERPEPGKNLFIWQPAREDVGG